MNEEPKKPDFEAYERLFLSLGDKTRLKLLLLMANEPVPVGSLVDELGESQPKVSRHLAYLRNSGVVSTDRDGKWIYYSIRSHSENPDLDRVVKFVISTLAGGTAVESTYVEHPLSEKAEVRPSKKKAKAPKIAIREVSVQQTAQAKSLELEEEEIFLEREEEVLSNTASSVEELEVFLL